MEAAESLLSRTSSITATTARMAAPNAGTDDAAQAVPFARDDKLPNSTALRPATDSPYFRSPVAGLPMAHGRANKRVARRSSAPSAAREVI